MAGLALGLAGYTILGQAGTSMHAPTVYLIRHGEKVSHVGCLNHTGFARAAMLPEVFDGRPGLRRSTFRIPEALFAHKYPNPICQRCVQTLEPIAKAHQLIIDSRPGDLPGEAPATSGTTMAAAAIRHALASHRTILVAWEHHQLPSLAMALGVPSEALPGAPTDEDVTGGELSKLWPANDFDTVYLLTFPDGTSGPANFTVTSEGLACHADTCRHTDQQVQRARSPAAGALEPFPQLSF